MNGFILIAMLFGVIVLVGLVMFLPLWVVGLLYVSVVVAGLICCHFAPEYPGDDE